MENRVSRVNRAIADKYFVSRRRRNRRLLKIRARYFPIVTGDTRYISQIVLYENRSSASIMRIIRRADLARARLVGNASVLARSLARERNNASRTRRAGVTSDNVTLEQTLLHTVYILHGYSRVRRASAMGGIGVFGATTTRETVRHPVDPVSRGFTDSHRIVRTALAGTPTLKRTEK